MVNREGLNQTDNGSMNGTIIANPRTKFPDANKIAATAATSPAIPLTHFILSVQYIKANNCSNKASYGPEKGLDSSSPNYFDEVYFVTALVPSETACFASSPGSRRRTAV